MLSVSKTKWVWFSFLISLVISSNMFIYRTDIIKPIPSEVVLGSLFDFIITIPFITYIFMIRKLILKCLVIVIAGYGLASLINPKDLYNLFIC